MTLTDIMSAADHATWQAVALLIFAVAFVAIVIHTLRRSRSEMQHAARLPIDEAYTPTSARSNGLARPKGEVQ